MLFKNVEALLKNGIDDYICTEMKIILLLAQ